MGVLPHLSLSLRQQATLIPSHDTTRDALSLRFSVKYEGHSPSHHYGYNLPHPPSPGLFEVYQMPSGIKLMALSTQVGILDSQASPHNSTFNIFSCFSCSQHFLFYRSFPQTQKSKLFFLLHTHLSSSPLYLFVYPRVLLLHVYLGKVLYLSFCFFCQKETRGSIMGTYGDLSCCPLVEKFVSPLESLHTSIHWGGWLFNYQPPSLTDFP
jgi:hypothetical protein